MNGYSNNIKTSDLMEEMTSTFFIHQNVIIHHIQLLFSIFYISRRFPSFLYFILQINFLRFLINLRF